MRPSQKAHGLHVTESNSVEEDSGLPTDEIISHHWHSNSADEGIAELDGPTSVPVLLEMLRERDDKIQVLGDSLLRVNINVQIIC